MGYLMSVPAIAAADLSASQYKAVTIGGTIAATGATAAGLQQNKPILGQGLTVGFAGRSRYVAGDTVAAGARLTITTSGFSITATSGDGVIGRALAAVASGGIGEAIVNFAAVAEQS